MTTRNSNNGDGHTSPSYDANGQKPEDDRKLFVGGLTWDTTQDDLREYFSNFGTILDCSIKHDPTTGRSRGFAFLVFDRKEIVDKILSHHEHVVKGRKIDPKPAHRRTGLAGNHQMNSISSSSSSNSISNNNRKVFIGGLDPNFPDVQLREYFSQFGPIDEIDLPYDKEKNERRPFCFISFQNEQSAQEVLRLQRHTIGEITVDVKRAKPKTLNNQQQQQQLYDPYGQQNMYAGYGTSVPSYGVNAYTAADAYTTAWNNYQYNQHGNAAAAAAAYPYGAPDSSMMSNTVPSNYQQYSQHQSNSQYSYGAADPSEYYPQYAYGAQHATSNVYADPNAYGAGNNYDYNYYQAEGAGVSGYIADNGSGGQQEKNSSNDANNYDHDSLYGKTKPSMIKSPNYHPYPIV